MLWLIITLIYIYPTPRVNSNVNYGLWMTMMGQYGFIDCNKGTTPEGDANGGSGCAWWGVGRGGGNMTFLYFLFSFAVNLKLR